MAEGTLRYAAGSIVPTQLKLFWNWDDPGSSLPPTVTDDKRLQEMLPVRAGIEKSRPRARC